MVVSEPLKIPVISWIINSRCNYRCGYCYTSGSNTHSPHYSASEIQALVESVETVSPTSLYLSGGEPLLDKSLLTFVRSARSSTFESIWICSNGSLVTAAVVRELKDEGVSGFSISLDHTIPQMMDLLTGSPGSFQKAINALETIKQAGLKTQLTITLMRQNMNVVPDLIRTGMDLEVDTIEFKRYRPVAARGENDKFSLEPEENRRVLREVFLAAHKNRNVNFFVHDPLFGVEYYRELEERGGMESLDRLSESLGCLAGKQWVGIDPFGYVSPCPLLLYSGLTIGNIKEQPLIDILLGSEEFYTLRNTSEQESACKYGSVCGGCRTHARLATGDYLQKDPMCPYEDYSCPSCFSRSSSV